MQFSDILLGNSLQRWAITFGVALIVTIILRALLSLVRNRAKDLAKSTSTIWDDVVVQALSTIRFSLIAPAVFCLAASTLTLPASIDSWLQRISVLLLLIQAGISISAAFDYWLDHTRKEKIKTDPGSVSGFSAIRFVGRFVIWTVIVLVALDNLGIDVSTLVTGLGVSGIAVALAVQNILGDLFASLTIILDKPFVVGDFLKVGDYLGTVQNIGLKTTRMRSLSGEQLVFSNTDLLQSRIQNYGRMEQRRISFSVGVTYQTTPERLEEIPGLIQKAIESQPDVQFNRSHFSGFGDFALMFETVYHVEKPDYDLFMDLQQNILLHIARSFAERDIEFAYPTQTLYLQKAESELTPAPKPSAA